jgi:hypothetical protein
LAGDFVAFPLAGAASATGSAPPGDNRETACQIRATAAFRLVNFFTGFRSSKGATPAKLFQMLAKRDAGHSAGSFASSFAVENVCDSSAPAGRPAWAVILFSALMVNVDMWVFSFSACDLRSSHSSLWRREHQVKSAAINR